MRAQPVATNATAIDDVIAFIMVNARSVQT
jgi:hypothetical protein